MARPTRQLTNDVCIVLNYYAPYVSGLSNVARDIAEGLAARGRRVTVVASQHHKNLPRQDSINGVRIVRTPVAFRIGKGVVSPGFVSAVLREAAQSRVVNIHAPMLEAGVIAAMSRTPVVMTYQCDVSLPPNMLGRFQNTVMDWSTRLAARWSRCVTVSSEDYAEHSRVRDALRERRVAIPPTCHVRASGQPRFREGDGFHVGFLGRIVEEKGIEYLVEGFRELKDRDARLLIAGDFSNVAGGGVIERVQARIEGDDRIRLLGFLPDEDIADFYASLDVFALPSVNPFEAFGIVQVEAMMLGVPVIASNLPGVRQPVIQTGMGVIVEPRSADQITDALTKLRLNRPDTQIGTALVQQCYALDAVLDRFEEVLDRAASEGRGQ